ncbi:LuxR C-terminal-related transcriptional regulator [Nocardia sp. NPDC050435]|uniref:LuxR C-terminal-related transcriptional regulator n=1 Tax=Nocardia sp. NPDC050435 TaxID=3155040 RepID=UPI0033E981D9
MTVSRHCPAPGAAGFPRFAFTPLPRTALRAQLDDLADAPGGAVLLICCPVGSGKTVLLSEWAQHRRTRARFRHTAWLPAEDPAASTTLWQRLASRLDLTVPPQPALSAPVAEAEALVAAIGRRRERHLIVLDDAHLITDPLTLAGLEHLLLRSPPNLLMVLSGRFEPPLRWHLLHMNARLQRWGSDKLAFTPGEAARLCREHGCELGASELALLMDLTRGWAAMLRIAAISLAAHAEDRTAALTALARLPVSVSDLLAGELIDALTPELRLFLTHTSVPVDFTEQLAAELAGGDAGHWLRELERLHYPLTSISRNGRVWYSYHPLPRAYFQAELNRYGAPVGQELRLRTARYLESAGEPAAALPHLLALPEQGPLLDFLREHGLSLTLSGFGPKLFDALASSRPLSEDPYLLLLRIVDALHRSDIPTARAYFDALRQRPDAQDSMLAAPALTALRTAVGCALATAGGLPAREIGSPEPVPATGRADLDCYTAIETATALLVHGDRAGGEERLRLGLATAEVHDHPQLRLRALVRLGMSAGLGGALGTMRRRAEYALELAHGQRLTATAEAAQAGAMAAFGAYLQGETELDRPEVLRAERILRDGSIGVPGGWHTRVIATLTRFDDAADKITAADRLRADYARMLDGDPFASATGGLLPFVVWALLRVREPYEAQLLVERTRTVLGEHPEIRLARAALAGDARRARAVAELVEPLLDDGPALHEVHRVTAWLLHAGAQVDLDNTAGAHESVQHALRHAAPERIVRPFLDVPGAIALLDRFVGSFGHCDAFAVEVRRHPLAHNRSQPSSLTGTELKVLRRLPSGRTSQEIADDLGISINTVKTHLRGIYSKLGTGSRTEALTVARRGGLL